MSHFLAVVFALTRVTLFLLPAGAAEKGPTTRPSGIVVEGARLRFNPKTCTEGTGGFAWGLGSVRITVRGHEEGKCVFDYQWEVEGAGNSVVHRVAVPVDSGPVVIDADQRGESEHHWSGGVFTSFTADQARLIRSYSFGWVEEPLEGTKDQVAHRDHRPGDKGEPPARGHKATVRFLLFTDSPAGDFVNLAGERWQRQGVTVTIGEGGEWRWVEQVVRDMTLY